MKSFKNKMTGVVLTPKNAWVEEQLAKNNSYEEVGAKKNTQNKKEKAIKDYSKKELVAFLTEKGIECDENMKKEELLLLVPESNEE